MDMVEIESERMESEELETSSIAESLVSPVIRNSHPEKKEQLMDSLVYSSHVRATGRPMTSTKQAIANLLDRPMTRAMEAKGHGDVSMEISQDFFEPKWDEPGSMVPQIIKQSVRKQAGKHHHHDQHKIESALLGFNP